MPDTFSNRVSGLYQGERPEESEPLLYEFPSVVCLVQSFNVWAPAPCPRPDWNKFVYPFTQWLGLWRWRSIRLDLGEMGGMGTQGTTVRANRVIVQTLVVATQHVQSRTIHLYISTTIKALI